MSVQGGLPAPAEVVRSTTLTRSEGVYCGSGHKNGKGASCCIECGAPLAGEAQLAVPGQEIPDGRERQLVEQHYGEMLEARKAKAAGKAREPGARSLSTPG